MSSKRKKARQKRHMGKWMNANKKAQEQAWWEATFRAHFVKKGILKDG